MRGVSGSITYNVTSSVGIVADLGAQYSTSTCSSGLRSSGPRTFNISTFSLENYEFLFGPRFVRRDNRLLPFAQVLVGVERARVEDRGNSAMALAVGGGIDLASVAPLTIRLFQVDYVPKKATGGWIHDLRIGAGVVFQSDW